MFCNLFFTSSFVGAQPAFEWISFFMGCLDMSGQIPFLSCFIPACFTDVWSDIVMYGVDVPRQLLLICRFIRTKVTHVWLDLMVDSADMFIQTFLCGEFEQALLTLKWSIIVFVNFADVLFHPIRTAGFEVTLLAFDERLLWCLFVYIFHVFI